MNQAENREIRWLNAREALNHPGRRQLLQNADLDPGDSIREAMVVMQGAELVATGAYHGRILRQIAVRADLRGQGLTALVVEELRKRLLARAVLSCLVYTKPAYQAVFASLGFRPLARAPHAVLLECGPDALGAYLKQLRAQASPPATDCGCIVMNANPFTRGHRWLVEQAQQRCGRLYLFILEENTTFFPAAVRQRLVRQGCADLPGVRVLGGGDYIISAATFPRYFIKKADQLAKTQAQLDVSLFTRHIAPVLSVGSRFAGQEPEDALTRLYNETMAALLPAAGIAFTEFPRIRSGDAVISASRVRKAFLREQWDNIREMVPPTTLDYLQSPEALELRDSLREVFNA